MIRLLRCWMLVAAAGHLWGRPMTLREEWHTWRAAWETTGAQ